MALSRTKKHLNVLVDTNVWLDYLLGRSGASEAVAAIQTALKHEDVLAVTTGIMKDVFFLVACTLKRRAQEEGMMLSRADAAAIHEACWACLSTIQSLAVVLNEGAAEHLEATALRSVHSDYEDNLLIAVAKRASLDYIITNDRALQSNSEVPAISPKQYAKSA